MAIVESLGLQCTSSHDERDIYTMSYTKRPYNNKFKLLSFVMKMPKTTKRCWYVPHGCVIYNKMFNKGVLVSSSQCIDWSSHSFSRWIQYCRVEHLINQITWYQMKQMGLNLFLLMIEKISNLFNCEEKWTIFFNGDKATKGKNKNKLQTWNLTKQPPSKIFKNKHLCWLIKCNLVA